MGAPQATRADDAQTDAAAQRDRGMGDDAQNRLGQVQAAGAVGRFNHESLVEQSDAAAQGFPITASRFRRDLMRIQGRESRAECTRESLLKAHNWFD